MQRFRIGIHATAIRNYVIEAPNLDEALRGWPAGTWEPDPDEIVAEEEPVFAEVLEGDQWRAIDLSRLRTRCA